MAVRDIAAPSLARNRTIGGWKLIFSLPAAFARRSGDIFARPCPAPLQGMGDIPK
jgi:hypothetical protein